MIEGGMGPLLDAVAFGAVLCKLVLMVVGVAVGTMGKGQRFEALQLGTVGKELELVAFIALNLLVFSEQGKLCALVVEVHLFPVALAVTRCAVLFELALVIVRVAVRAVGKGQIAKAPCAMTCFARYILVFADELEARAIMVESLACLAPIVDDVATLAVGAEAGYVRVGVAVGAIGKGQRFKALQFGAVGKELELVAFIALDLLVFSEQGKLCALMVEVHLFPVAFAVAFDAVLLELSLVVVCVAVCTIGEGERFVAADGIGDILRLLQSYFVVERDRFQ